MTFRELLYRALPPGHRWLPERPALPPAIPSTTPEQREVDHATSLTAGQARQQREDEG